MFEPVPELIQTHHLTVAPGLSVVFDQTLWGKVIEVAEVRLEGGRYALDDRAATAPLRAALEAATIEGQWAFSPDHPRRAAITAAVHDLLATYFEVS